MLITKLNLIKLFVLSLLAFLVLLLTPHVFAVGQGCSLSSPACPSGEVCVIPQGQTTGTCQTGGSQLNINLVPPRGVDPNANIGTVINTAITIVFIVAALVVLFFLILGAFSWITSGGDKEKIQKARGTIVNALIGMAILALAFLLVNVVAQILGFGSVTSFTIPTLPSASSTP